MRAGSVRSLLLTWLMLLALTAVVGVLAAGNGSPGAISLLLLGLLIVAKARLIMTRYLRLELEPAFLAAFTATVVVILSISVIAALIDIPPLRLPKPDNASTSHPGKPARPSVR